MSNKQKNEDNQYPINMIGVYELQEGGNAELDILNGRQVIVAYSESGHNCTTVDLLDLLHWIVENKPEIYALCGYKLKINDSPMENGDRVALMLHNNDNLYYGEVLNAKKEWVMIDPIYYPNGFIADECSIEKYIVVNKK